MARATKKQIEESMLYLTKQVKLKPGDMLYTHCTRVSRSNCTRFFKVYVVRHGEIWDITGSVARVGGYRYKNGEWGEIMTDAYGNDIVEWLGVKLFPNGFMVGKRLLAKRPSLPDSYCKYGSLAFMHRRIG